MKIDNHVLISDTGTKYLYSGKHQQFAYLSGELNLSNEAIDTFKANINKRNAFCDERNILYKHIVFPSKPVVFADKLPSFNLSSIMNEELMLKNVLYPLSEYQNAKPAFFESDTHPTPKGSWEVTKLIAQYVDVDLGIPKYVKAKHIGDLNVMLGSNIAEEFDRFIGLENYFYKTLDVNNYEAVSGNNEKIRIIKNPLAKTNKRVLIFGDSFFNFNLNEQLALLFEEIIFIRTPNFLYEIVDYIKPDMILTGQVERYLVTPISDEQYKYPLLHTLLCSVEGKTINVPFSAALNALFANKNSQDYQRWHSNNSANLFRDVAVSLESSNLNLALELMKKALLNRPTGKVIMQKIEDYKKEMSMNYE